MQIHYHVQFGNLAKRAASTASIVALSVVTTLFVQHVVAPPPANARSFQAVTQPEFIVSGGTGTIARLGPGPLGNGNLRLWDTSGNLRVEIAGDGTAHIWDASGNTLWSAP
jgi:hypothetical protein